MSINASRLVSSGSTFVWSDETRSHSDAARDQQLLVPRKILPSAWNSPSLPLSNHTSVSLLSLSLTLRLFFSLSLFLFFFPVSFVLFLYLFNSLSDCFFLFLSDCFIFYLSVSLSLSSFFLSVLYLPFSLSFLFVYLSFSLCPLFLSLSSLSFSSFSLFLFFSVSFCLTLYRSVSLLVSANKCYPKPTQVISNQKTSTRKRLILF